MKKKKEFGMEFFIKKMRINSLSTATQSRLLIPQYLCYREEQIGHRVGIWAHNPFIFFIKDFIYSTGGSVPID